MRGLVHLPSPRGCASTFQLSGDPDTHFYNCIAEIQITITSILPRADNKKRETEELASVSPSRERETSEREYEEDA